MVDSNQLKKYAKKHFTFTGKKIMNRIPSTNNIWITQQIHQIKKCPSGKNDNNDKIHVLLIQK